MEEIMSEETLTPEVEEEVQEAVDTELIPDPPQPDEGKQLSLQDLQCGYIVGMTEDGNFVFELVGQKRELLSLLGLHQYANERVRVLHGRTQMTGEALVNEVGKAVNLLNQKVDSVASALQQALSAGKPQNQL